MAKGTGTYDDPIIVDGIFSKTINGVKKFFKLNSNGSGSAEHATTNRGQIAWFAQTEAPNGYLVCNGANVSRTTYADLFNAIGTTFGSGDGSTTFNIPDLRDRYIIGANTNTLGTYIAEQLPNIKGKFQIRQTATSDGTELSETIIENSGLCSTQITSLLSGLYPLAGSTANRQQVDFNAHNSNSVYTDSGKVYPLSLALLPCIKY